jgi:DNA helicase-2/ATP-dependent DNA helicase PcrA
MNDLQRDLARLNPDQEKILKQFKGPTLVTAGPGTGKTRTIAALIGRLLHQGVRLKEILALTFSDKAAEELRERVLAYFPQSYDECWISTFHSFCSRLLRAHFFQVDVPPDFKLLSSFKEAILMQEICRTCPPGEFPYFERVLHDRGFQQEVLTFISLLKSNLVTPDALLTVLRRESKSEARLHKRLEEIHRLFRLYEEERKRLGYLDFRDLISLTVRLLQSPTAAGTLSSRFRYVLVDEFQDTDPAQYHLLSLLAPPAAKPLLAVVGDPRQSIYRFRGADPGIIGKKGTFRRDYSARTFDLFRNYRSGATLVTAAGRLAFTAADQDSLGKPLQAEKATSGRLECYVTEDAVAEARLIARKIAGLTIYGGERVFRPEEIAVLVRNNYQLDFLAEALKALGIPFAIAGDMKFFRSEEVILVSSLLKAAASQGKELEIALRRAFASPRFGLTPVWVQSIFASLGNSRSLMDFLDHLEPGDDPSNQDHTKALAFREAFRTLENAAQEPLPHAVGRALLFLRDCFLRPDSTEARNLVRFREMAVEFGEIFQRRYDRLPCLSEFTADFDFLLPYFASTLETAEPDKDRSGVRLMTIHQSKGLEFPVVFIPGLCEGVFPVRIRQNTLIGNDGVASLRTLLNQDERPFPFFNPFPESMGEHLEEERRLFFVAVTRAQESLTLTYARRDGNDRVLPSIFLDELGVRPVEEAPDKAPVSWGEVRIMTAALSEADKAALKERLRHAPPDPEETADAISEATLAKAFRSESFGSPAVDPVDLPDKPVFSAQSIKDYLDCPRRFYFRTLLRVRDPLVDKRPEILRGKTIHACLEQLHSPDGIWEQGKLPSAEDLADIWARAGAPMLSELDPLKRLSCERQVKLWLEAYVGAVFQAGQLPARNTDSVEKTRLFTFRGFRCLTRIDRLVLPDPETAWIIDYKSGAGESSEKLYERAFADEDAPSEIQLPFYLLAMQEAGFRQTAAMTLYVAQPPYKRKTAGLAAGHLRSAALNRINGPSWGVEVDPAAWERFSELLFRVMTEITTSRLFDCRPSNHPKAVSCLNFSFGKQCEFLPYCRERLDQLRIPTVAPETGEAGNSGGNGGGGGGDDE